MGRLPESPIEVRLAVLLFLAMLGLADAFGAWQVKNFAAFTPSGVAASVAPEPSPAPRATGHDDGRDEAPVDLATLDRENPRIPEKLLVEDTHVHVPVYAITAGALSLIVCGLALSSRARSLLIVSLFLAPLADFAGLWGAHLWPESGFFFGLVAVGGGFGMGLAYLVVFGLVLDQCWLRRHAATEDIHA